MNFKTKLFRLSFIFLLFIGSFQASAADYYWVGGTGNWSDYGNHWATTSGGVIFHTTNPSPLDDVYFDSNSFISSNDTVYIDSTLINCRSMDWTGAGNNPVFKRTYNTDELKVYGSLTLIAAMDYEIYYTFFASNAAGNTITSSGHALGNIKFEGSGSWLLTDTLNAGSIQILNGNLNTNNQTVNSGSIAFVGPNPINLQLGTSLIQTQNWTVNLQSNPTLGASSSTIIASSSFQGGTGHVYNDVSTITMNSNNNTFHDISVSTLHGDNSTIHSATFSSFLTSEIEGSGNSIQKAVFIGDGDILGSNTFDTLIFNNPTSNIILSDTQFVNNLLSLNGTCNGFSSLESVSSGVPAFVKKATGTVTLDYVILKDISGIGGASFTANNSIDNGNVTGWTVNSPVANNLYWIGGTGNWSDVNHWSVTSGGTGGSCVPGPSDNVYFDLNSFSSPGDTVYYNEQEGYCKSVDWTGAGNNPVFYRTNGTNELKIYGSLTLIAAMDYAIYNTIFASNAAGNTITSSGHALGNIKFEGSGSWLLTDTLNAGSIQILNGNLNTNNQTVNSGSIAFVGPNPINLQLGTSLIQTQNWTVNLQSNPTLGASSSTIIASSSFQGGTGHIYNDVSTITMNSNNNTFHDITVSKLQGDNSTIHHAIFNSLLSSDLIGSGNSIQKAVFIGDGKIMGSNSFDTLTFLSHGSNMLLEDSTIINSAFWTNAIPGFPISIGSINPGTQATIFATPGSVLCLDYLYIQDINTTGGATFYAGDHSVDLGNNTGWTWSSCTPDTSDVWPGDANYDLTADNIDILYIGLAYGYTGPVRTGASTSWIAQPGIDWEQQFATGYNIKHADCDGNGTIDATDTAAVILNYGLVHPFKQPFPPTVTSFGTPLYFDLPAGPLTPGAVADIPIMFGTANEPADKFYGVAFSVNYDPALIQPGSMEITFGASWFGTVANTIHINKDFYNNGIIDMAFVKTDHADEAGYGVFATLHFTLDNNASGPLNLSFSKILVLDKYEIPQPVNVTNGSVFTEVNDISYNPNILVYPNPVQDVLTIDAGLRVIENIRLFNADGKVVLHMENMKSKNLDMTRVASGVYTLEIITKEGINRKRVVLVNASRKP